MGRLAFLPAVIGFLAGIGFLLLLDENIPHLHMDGEAEGVKVGLSRNTMLLLAVTLHNIPEGTAAGIAIQNFPEGAIISMPLRSEGMPGKSVFVRSGFRCGRACRSIADDTCRRYDPSCYALSFKLCGLWKVYGSVENAKRIFAGYDGCRTLLCINDDIYAVICS